MQIGIVIPGGVDHEFDGWDPAAAAQRCFEIASHAEALGYHSAWVYDHFQTDPTPIQEITFESFTVLAALAATTRQLRLGHLVLGIGYRNPALVAKMAGTLDAISAGRFELGLGAGWKEDEYVAYGYPFPPLKERLAILRESLEVITRLVRNGRGTYRGAHVRIEDAINVPSSVQRPHLPIIVGGNGPRTTWRLAARFADELNLDGLAPAAVEEALPVVRLRCEEVGRDPATLRISVHLWGDVAGGDGRERSDRLRAYRELGVERAIVQIHETVRGLDALDRLKADAEASGATFA